MALVGFVHRRVLVVVHVVLGPVVVVVEVLAVAAVRIGPFHLKVAYVFPQARKLP